MDHKDREFKQIHTESDTNSVYTEWATKIEGNDSNLNLIRTLPTDLAGNEFVGLDQLIGYTISDVNYLVYNIQIVDEGEKVPDSPDLPPEHDHTEVVMFTLKKPKHNDQAILIYNDPEGNSAGYVHGVEKSVDQVKLIKEMSDSYKKLV